MHVFGRALCALVLSIFVVFAIAGCGGGDDKQTTIGPPTKVTLSTTAISLDLGQVFTGLSATVQDANNNTICTTTGAAACPVTYGATPAGIIDIANNGWICAGTWNSKTAPVVCNALTPAQGVGQVNLVGTYQSINSAATVVNTHVRISRITLTPATGGCTSSGQTQQLTARAFDAANVDVTSTAGTFLYQISDSTVGTMSTTGLVTAVRPGAATTVASIGPVSSLPYTFETCPPASIAVVLTGSSPTATNATLPPGATAAVTVTVTDTKGSPYPNDRFTLSYNSSAPRVATLSSIGTITASVPGNATLVVSCTPPSCNPGVNQPIYSNPFNLRVTGATATTVYATGANATQIVPVDVTTNTAGTPITIPTVTPTGGTATQPTINSAVMAPGGDRLFLGSNLGLLTLSTAANTFETVNQNLQGRVLAVSPDGARVLIKSGDNANVFALHVSTQATTILPIANATEAAWTPDSLKAFIVSGNTMYVYSPALGNRTVTLGSAALDIAAAPQGTFAYASGGNSLQVIAVCTNNTLTNVSLSGTPTLVEAALNGARIFAVDTNSIHRVDVTIPTQPCPPSDVTNSPTSFNFGSGSFTPRQLIVLSDATKAYVTSNFAGLLALDANAGTTSTIALTGGGAPTTGGATLDAAAVYVGATVTNDVKRIDTATGAVTHSIAVNLKKADNTPVPPDFVVVKP